MSSIRRFYREHLLRFLPAILGGMLLLLAAGLCQSLLIGSLNFVFKDNLHMAPPGAKPFR